MSEAAKKQKRLSVAEVVAPGTGFGRKRARFDAERFDAAAAKLGTANARIAEREAAEDRIAELRAAALARVQAD